MSELKKERLVVFDFIRVVAILLVVLCHTLKVEDLPIKLDWMGILGNSLFFFISGYLIYLNNSKISSIKDIFSFYKKRVIRIYPLYIFAILCFFIVSFFVGDIIVLGNITDYSLFEIIISVLGLQMVFLNQMSGGLLLWFIGMIIVYYLIYPIVMYISKNSPVKYLIYSSLAICMLFLAKTLFGIFGSGIFAYYFLFVAGVIFAWYNIFQSKYRNKLSILSGVIFVIGALLIQFCNMPISGIENITSLNIISFLDAGFRVAFKLLFGISTAFVIYDIYSHVKLNSTITSLIINMSTASYAVYLFHCQIMAIFDNIISLTGNTFSDILFLPIIYDVLLMSVFIPLIFVIGYFLQKGENICIKKIKMKFSTKH
ncbi:MAG: acyltransferase [Methanocorpusculum sp.]|nr:acyltransferase [Methanocorpusculum sp.]